MGQAEGRPTRSKMLTELKEVSGEYFENINSGWQSKDMLSTEEYKKILEDSVFVPCPRGNESVDTFRLYETLEVGSIPLIEKDSYWGDLLGEHPLIEVPPSWEGVGADLELLLSHPDFLHSHRKKISAWWTAHKAALKSKILGILRDAHTLPVSGETKDSGGSYDICFCCDANLIPHISTVLNSIVSQNAGADIRVHILHTAQDEAFNAVKKFVATQPELSLFLYNTPIPSSNMVGDPLGDGNLSYVTTASHLKYLIPEVLAHLERALYLDIDLLAPLPLSLLYNKECGLKGIAARSDMTNGFLFTEGYRTANTGVMLMDLAKLRELKFTERCLSLPNPVNHEQQVINLFLQGDYVRLDSFFNLLYSVEIKQIISPNHLQHYDLLMEDGVLYKRYTTQDITGGYILHFMGAPKPWDAPGDGADLWGFFTPVEPGLFKKQKEFIELRGQWANFKDYKVFDFCATQGSSPQAMGEAFSCYNPGKKIAIVSLYTPEISSYAVESEKNIRAYCEGAGYTFYVYRKSLDPSSHGNWSKAKALLNHHDDHEVLIWMDSDTLIFNPLKRFEEILERCTPIKKVIACEDIGTNNTSLPKGSMFNSGVVIFRCHPSTKKLLGTWWDFRLKHDTSSLYASGGDQEVLINLLKQKDGFGFNRKVFPMNTFNTEPRFVDEDTFIIHFMAYPRSLKDVFIFH